jgi:radical SAM superfamily enzyme YgiQ (UPF0313 family)
MRFEKVLLVFPVYKCIVGSFIPPIGLGYIAQSLEDNGIEYEVIDMGSGDTHRTLKKKIEEFKPDLVGISLMSVNYKSSYNIINFIKTIDRNACIVVGGPHISAIKSKIFEECESIDFGIAYDGEKAIVELCKGENLEEIEGLIYRDKGTTIHIRNKELESNLDIFSYPLYNKFRLNSYITGGIGIVTSRGCPHKCIFCSIPKYAGSKYRMRSINNIVEEIEYRYDCGYKNIMICDDNFAFDKDRVIEICNRIIKLNLKDLTFHVSFGLRADTVDKEILAKMKKAGFKYITFGVESGSDKILKSIRKGETLKTIDNAVADATGIGLEVTLFFTIGHPVETFNDFNESLAFSRKYNIADAEFFPLVPYPETELFDFVSKGKYFILYPEHYLNNPSIWYKKPVFATPCFTEKERIKAINMGLTTRKNIKYTWMKSMLRRLGIFSGIFAMIYSNNAIQKILNHSRIRRYLIAVFNKISL